MKVCEAVRFMVFLEGEAAGSRERELRSSAGECEWEWEWEAEDEDVAADEVLGRCTRTEGLRCIVGV